MNNIEYQNIENQIFTELPSKVIGCNIESCVFNNAENCTFERCNAHHCEFKTISTFDRSNLIVCDLIEGSTYIDSNIINEEPE